MESMKASLEADLKDTRRSLEGKVEAVDATVHRELHSLQRTIIQIGGGLAVAMLAMIATLMGVLATHL